MNKKLIVLILVVQIVFFGLFVTSCTKSDNAETTKSENAETVVDGNNITKEEKPEEVVISYDGIYVDQFSDETINQLINGVNSTIQGVVDGFNTVDEITDIDSFINSYREKSNENDFTQELISLMLESLIKYAKGIKNAYYVSKIVPEEIKTDKIVIPSTWKDGNKIIVIGSNVLGKNNKITDIVIQEGITHILDEAFKGCTALSSLTVPESVYSIGNNVFEGCNNLAHINLFLRNILASQNDTFNGSSIKTIDFNGTIEQWNSMVTDRNIFLDDNVILNCSNRKVNEGDFAGLYVERVLNLYTLKHVNGSEIAFYAYVPRYWKNGGKIGIISSEAFKDCDEIFSVTIEDGIGMIMESAFEGCSSLVNISIPESVSVIGKNAFRGCSSLSSINIPKSAFFINGDIFGDCDNLEDIYYQGTYSQLMSMPDKIWIDTDSGADIHCTDRIIRGEKPSSTGVYVEKIPYSKNYRVSNVDAGRLTSTKVVIPAEHNDGYITEIGKEAFEYCNGLTRIKLPNTITKIGDMAFYKCSGLTSIMIPDSVTEIGEYAFEDCSGLTSITIPDSVTVIGNGAFKECSGLTSITIPNSVTEIGEDAFYGCSGLTSITIPGSIKNIRECFSDDGYNETLREVVLQDGITSIGYKAFANYSGLTSITIPDSVTEIGEYAFAGCSGLTSITIPDSVTEIGKYAFRGCSGLTSITIPDSVTVIGNGAFKECSGLTSITIPNSVTEIGEDAFWGCSGLTSITIPDSVTVIGGGAFYECSGLTSITIPDSVTVIGNGAFKECSGLTSITIPDSVTEIGYRAFTNCSGLTSITIPNSVTEIGLWAFEDCSGLTEIHYTGTREQWRNVSKVDGWAGNCPLSVVHCTDGDIKIE